MAAGSHGPTLSDTLAALPKELLPLILNGGVLEGADKRKARLACRAFRDAIDGTVEAASLPESSTLLQVAEACPAGWLQRRPRLRKLTLPFNNARRLVLPFAAADPAAAWGQITELVLGSGKDHNAPALPGTILQVCLSPLSGLRSLTLHTAPPDTSKSRAWRRGPDKWTPEQRLTSQALSSLPNLTSLTTSWYGHLPLLPDKLTQQLTRLDADPYRRALGPRLAQLTVDCLDPDKAATWNQPARLERAEAVRKRCDRVTVGSLEAFDGDFDVEDVLTVSRVLGVPERIQYNNCLLRLRRPQTTAAGADAGGEAAHAWQAPLPPEVLLQRVVERLERAGPGTGSVQRMEAAAFSSTDSDDSSDGDSGDSSSESSDQDSDEDSDEDSELLLRGPLMETLSNDPAALRNWLVRLRDRAGAGGGSQRRFSLRCVPLPAVRAALVTCIPAGPHTKPVAAAAQQLAADGGGGGGGGGGTGAAELRVQRCGLRFAKATEQVLEALWEGEAEGEGAGAEVGDELDQLRRLLEAVRELLDQARGDGAVDVPDSGGNGDGSGDEFDGDGGAAQSDGEAEDFV